MLGLGLAVWSEALWSEKGEMVAQATLDIDPIHYALASGLRSKHWAG